VQPFPPLHLVLRRLVEAHSDTMNSLVSNRRRDIMPTWPAPWLRQNGFPGG
jgi:hypothetical protein